MRPYTDTEVLMIRKLQDVTDFDKVCLHTREYHYYKTSCNTEYHREGDGVIEYRKKTICLYCGKPAYYVTPRLYREIIRFRFEEIVTKLIKLSELPEFRYYFDDILYSVIEKDYSNSSIEYNPIPLSVKDAIRILTEFIKR